MAIYNAGPVLWIGDLGVPLVILVLLGLRAIWRESISSGSSQ